MKKRSSNFIRPVYSNNVAYQNNIQMYALFFFILATLNSHKDAMGKKRKWCNNAIVCTAHPSPKVKCTSQKMEKKGMETQKGKMAEIQCLQNMTRHLRLSPQRCSGYLYEMCT